MEYATVMVPLDSKGSVYVPSVPVAVVPYSE
ncbi:hypothetical protein DesfrDRAFT_3551 [Solidesulfovibrio fructosivorans JJ]]|uniref:Uncharacterized protein n=1 Tax=Solidesulfovibrio fructosivorans JJ] TaxID=596151 RepID=E1K101_SOLFR|nr:hypothetical protein DesfrDRAFT_3551 [Solidesulfovibrio fructosivorans JJ]]